MSRNITLILCLSSSSWSKYHCGVNRIACVMEKLVSILPFAFINMAGKFAEFVSLT